MSATEASAAQVPSEDILGKKWALPSSIAMESELKFRQNRFMPSECASQDWSRLWYSRSHLSIALGASQRISTYRAWCYLQSSLDVGRIASIAVASWKVDRSSTGRAFPVWLFTGAGLGSAYTECNM